VPNPAHNLEPDELLALIREVVLELHPRRGQLPVTMDSHLERDLGLDSLGRIELLQRLELRYGLVLPEQAVLAAETPADLWQALGGQHGLPPPAAAMHRADSKGGGAIPVPDHAETLTEVLEWHAGRHPDRPHIQFYQDQDDGPILSYGTLLAGARKVAAGLRQRGVEPGHTVALMLPTGEDFFHVFAGILLAGAIPVPIYPPQRRNQLAEHLRRQATILDNAGCRVLVSMEQARNLVPLLKTVLPHLQHVPTPGELSSGGDFRGLRARPGDLALLQYTSGSTGTPKGVVLSHANLLANIRAMGQAVQASSTDVFVSWLPLYHDMGLIGAWLGSLYHGCRLVLMSPLAFIARPVRWLQAIHRHGGTLSAAPNFAYEFCASRIAAKDLEGLDLSSWRVAFNGAEPISPQSMQRFIDRFAPHGFRRETMAPVYGLAENCVGLAFPPLERGPLVDRIQRTRLQTEGLALPASEEDGDVQQIVACGRALPGHRIRIAGKNGETLGDRQVGRLQFQGPSATTGYYRNPRASAELIQDGWLDSGDYAYQVNGEVYITGRAKELIIRAGRNIQPFEMEQALGRIEGIRSNQVAVFASPDPDTGSERVIVLAETKEHDPERLRQLRRQVDELAIQYLQTPADDVVLAPPGSIPRTSSGKIRRNECRQRYERGQIGRKQNLWWQLARLSLSGLPRVLQRGMRTLSRYLFAGYAWSVFSILTVVAWPLIVLLPGQSLRRRAPRWAARTALHLTGQPIHVEGLPQLPDGRPCILVANHTSYLDAMLLTAALPPRYAFVAKRELLDNPWTKYPLQRLGAIFVERFDPHRSRNDTHRLNDALRAGQSLIFFPEGTFDAAPGLKPFRMGAFVAAATSGVPIVPVVIRGSRAMLRSGSWLPRHGRPEVIVTPPLEPEGSGWQAAIRLRDATRRAILRHCDEPDLA
jgi:1-acyl-sn-glycerol-3-phosphate acyltransferase